MKPIVSILLLLFASLLCNIKVQAQDQTEPALISVTGSASTHAKPDEIQIDITIVQRDKNMTMLTELMNNQSEAIITILHDANVTDEDIETSKVAMWPHIPTRYSPYVIPGPDYYTAKQSLAFILRNASEYDSVMTKLYEAGIDSVDSVVFQLSPDLLQATTLEAQKKAAESAQKCLDTLVGSLKLKIGNAYSVEDYTVGGDPKAFNGYQNSPDAVFQNGEVVFSYEDGYGGDSSSSETSFLPQDFEISSTIYAKYFIL